MIYSYTSGGSSGVSRFENELLRVFPEMKCVTRLPELNLGDVVITDNHLSIDVSQRIKTIAVHHGCAQTHYDRDEKWRDEWCRSLTKLQRGMFHYPNRIFVAPSEWVLEQFGSRQWSTVIPHWVESINRLPVSGSPIIIGDWRDNNKGANVWRKLQEARPDWKFSPLHFTTQAGKELAYGTASIYLCLSLSEGGSYSMCDAEAAGLPIVSTDVGNYREFTDCEVIRWQDRDDLQIVIDAIERKLKVDRQKPSFYQEYTFDMWAELWRNVVSL